MRTPMARPGRRSPGRTPTVPAVSYRRLAARGGRPVALARLTGAAPDIIELIVARHERSAGCCVRTTTPQASARVRVVLERNPGLVPRRWQVCTLSRSSWECARCSRFRCRSIRIGVLLAHRDAPGPMDGGVLADLLVLTHQTEAQLGPGAVGSEPQWMSDQRAGYRAQVRQAPS